MNSGICSEYDKYFFGPWVVDGNAAKVKVICEVANRLRRNTKSLSILDIGCAGPQPLRFWEPIAELHDNFELIGIDVRGIESAREIVRERGWKQIRLQQGSGYHLTDLFAPASFDIVIATQVLEHIAQPIKFMQEIAVVLRPGGEVFLTMDSAHWESRFILRYPLRFVKNTVKKMLAIAGDERHYDLPWYDHEIITFVNASGLEVECCRYYNIHPLKLLHNHLIPDSIKNNFMRDWFNLEEMLNDAQSIESIKKLCAGLYFCLKRP